MALTMITRSLLGASIIVTFALFVSCSSKGNPQRIQTHNLTLSVALTEVRSIEPPAGVDGALFESLKMELETMLVEIWGGADRIASRAPSGDAGRVTDLEYDSETGYLTWSYVNVGDYDCNGEVGVPDITPVALNYLALSDDGVGDDAREKWIDGDGNGEIGIPDVTSIALGYLSQVAEYIIVTSDTAEGEYDEIGRVPFPGAPEFPVTFDVALPPGAKEFIAVQPVDGNGNAGERSNHFINSGNNPPIAQIVPSVAAGDSPLIVDFDASGSYDTDGDVVNYEWDFDGNGIWDDDTGTTPYASYEYTEPGTYNATLRVTDNGGKTNTAAHEIIVTGNIPPVAVFEATPDSGEEPLAVFFNASSSYDPDGTIIQFEWDFDGDGEWDFSAPNPYGNFEYTDAGTYNSTLRVTDNGGKTNTTALEIVVTGNIPPVASFEATPESGEEPLSVFFNAFSSYDPDGTITQFDWDFDGDGEWDFSAPNPYGNYEYTSPGTYNATLRVTDNGGKTNTAAHEIIVTGNFPPVAVFEATPSIGDEPLAVFFNASSSYDPDGTITQFAWDFDGDGEWDFSAPNPYGNYEYTEPDTYNATLRVTDNGGKTNIADLVIVVTGNSRPFAEFEATPDGGAAPLSVFFNASSSYDADGTIIQFEWDYDGDGVWDFSAPNPYGNFEYTEAGTYSATLRVTDNGGKTQSKSKPIMVT